MDKKWMSLTMLALALALALAGFSGCGGTSATPTTTSPTIQPSTPTTFDQTLVSVTSANGLSLTLSIDSTSYKSGDEVSITIDEKNTLTKDNNITVADLWPAQGLIDGPTGTVNYPFGVSILPGYYDTRSAASIAPLIIYNPNAIYNGPMQLANITSYDFQPSSGMAAIYTKYDSQPTTISMTVIVGTTGSWGNGPLVVYRNFTPGIYTVVGGDEWGALVTLHFVIV